jgi:hypothetical protein
MTVLEFHPQSFTVVHNPAPALLPGCLVRIPTTAWRPFVFPLAYETLILGITFIKTSTIHSRTPVLMRLLRDGTMYYVAVVIVLAVTTIGATNNAVRRELPLRLIKTKCLFAHRHGQLSLGPGTTLQSSASAAPDSFSPCTVGPKRISLARARYPTQVGDTAR